MLPNHGEPHEMTQAAQTTVAVAATITPAVTFITFSAPSLPAASDRPEPMPHLWLVE